MILQESRREAQSSLMICTFERTVVVLETFVIAQLYSHGTAVVVRLGVPESHPQAVSANVVTDVSRRLEQRS